MQWLVNIICLIFVSILCTHELELIIDNEPNNSNKSAIACQDTLIELDCALDEYPKPISGYYGRYSIQACNPNYKNFPTGCINSNITENFENLCNKTGGVCRILASPLLFGSPCGNSTHVLEVNYICIKIESTTTRRTTTEANKTTVNIEDEYNDDDYSTIIDYKTTKDLPSKVDEIISSNRIDYIIEENIKNESKISLNGIANIINFVKQSTVELEETKEQSYQALINTANLLFNKTDAWKELNKKEKSKSATLLMDLIEKEIFSTNIKIDNIQIDTKNIAAEFKFNSELKSELQFPTSDKLNIQEKVFLKLKKPKSDQKFLFMVYNNINDFMSANENINRRSEDKRKEDEILNTNIISFKMNKEDENYLKEYPVELTFQHLNEWSSEENHKPICSYWQYDQITYEGEWKQDGCHIIKTNKTHTTCSCNHLTHFAVLMDIHGIYEKLENLNHHAYILKMLTIILSLLSIICLILNIYVFNFTRILKRSRENSANKHLRRITTHLCVCLLISLFVFLSGIFIKDLKIKIHCSIIAIISHYMFLCSFFWMLVQGVQLYRMLIKIFNLGISPVSKFCLIAYGLPLIIVVISVILNDQLLNGKGYGTEAHCWLSSYQNFNLSFIIPVSIILLANLVILLIVMYSVRENLSSRKTYLNYNSKQEKFYKSLAISGYLIMTLLGLPWIVGYFILNTQNTLIFSYIFTILNSSQGIIIFSLNFIGNKSVREEFFKCMCNNDKFGLISSGSNSSKSHSSSKTSSQNNSSDRHPSFSGAKDKNYKEKHTKILYQFLTCLRKKNVYELKQDGLNNLNCIMSGQHDSILRIQQKQLPNLEDDSRTRLLIYDPMPSYITCNHQIKNPLHFHPYHREYHLPKRSSSHVSSNSSNSNRTHVSYAPPLIPTSETILVANQGPLFLQSTDSFKMRQPSYHQYYLIPRQHDTLLMSRSTRPDYNDTILSHNINNDHLINYANQNLPQPPRPRQNFKPLKTSLPTTNLEEHNYSLIENELQTDLQYYCDEPICSHAIEEDDFNTNSYTEVPNQYDELDNMLASSSSSMSSLSKTNLNNNNTKKSNQISTPKNASLLTFNKK